ncbi:DNA-binding protein, partial [Burkholderia multivorans]
REPMEFANGTVFHFVDASPAEALEMAKTAAEGLDVRLGGGPTSVKEFLDADLIDFIHTVTVPVVLGTGVRLWENPEVLDNRFSLESVSTESGLT